MTDLTRICSTIDAAKDRRWGGLRQFVKPPWGLTHELTQQSPPPPISAGPKPRFEAGIDAGFDAANDSERGPDTDGLAAAAGDLCGIRDANTELLQRIARKEVANEALIAKLEATLADMRSLQRQNEHWRAECVRLSALLVETQQQLAQRMAMPANALRWGGR